MLLLERHGATFGREDVWRLWVDQLPPGQTWGPERGVLLQAGMASLWSGSGAGAAGDDWAAVLNPGDEHRGALVRVDAYGYACAGRPALAAELAWRDAGRTHLRTGVYGAMWLAAALAVAPVFGTGER